MNSVRVPGMERAPPKDGYPNSLWLAVAGALFGAFQFGERSFYQLWPKLQQLCP